MQPQDLGKRLFTFAVIADSHLNQDELDCNSPFPVNKLANRRMRHVVRDLNRRDVAFVVHLGDLIHPVPAVKELYAGAAARFHAQVRELNAPLHLTPGNHDIGDKPMPWARRAPLRKTISGSGGRLSATTIIPLTTTASIWWSSTRS